MVAHVRGLTNLARKLRWQTRLHTVPGLELMLNLEEFVANILFTQKAVSCALLSLDINKWNGPDSMPVILRKMCAPELTLASTHIFKLSYNHGVVCMQDCPSSPSSQKG